MVVKQSLIMGIFVMKYSNVRVQVGTIHHDAETTKVWVVDKPAYTEYVYGEKCSGCGATK